MTVGISTSTAARFEDATRNGRARRDRLVSSSRPGEASRPGRPTTSPSEGHCRSTCAKVYAPTASGPRSGTGGPMAYERRMMPLLYQEEVLAPAKSSLLTVDVIHSLPDRWLRHGIRGYRRHRRGRGRSRLQPSTGTPVSVLRFGTTHPRGACPESGLSSRRLAVAPDAPHCTASRMLGQMARWIRTNLPDVPVLLSYQDMDVHTGTIYRAAGWTPAYHSRPRIRDRSKARVGTRRRLSQQPKRRESRCCWQGQMGTSPRPLLCSALYDRTLRSSRWRALKYRRLITAASGARTVAPSTEGSDRVALCASSIFITKAMSA